MPTMAGDGHRITFILSLLLLASRYAVAQSDATYNNSVTAFSFNTSMIILMTVLGFAFVVLSVFSLYIRYCTAGAATGGGPDDFQWRQPQGLSRDVLETFPTMVYAEVKGLRSGKQELECAVCLSEFEDRDTLRLLPPCNHVFHLDCVDAWLASNVTCPVCRTNLAVAAAQDMDPRNLAAGVHNNAPDGAPFSALEQIRDERMRLPLHVAIEIDRRAEYKEEKHQKRAEAAVMEKLGGQQHDPGSSSRPQQPYDTPKSDSILQSPHNPAQWADRHTLMLSEDLLRDIIAKRNLYRSARFHVVTREESGRKSQSFRLGMSDRWSDIITRTLSSRFP